MDQIETVADPSDEAQWTDTGDRAQWSREQRTLPETKDQERTGQADQWTDQTRIATTARRGGEYDQSDRRDQGEREPAHEWGE